MKRFWTDATTVARTGGVAIQLDGRPVRTPRGNGLILPNPGLAAAVAAEWQAVEGEVRPHAMPLTGLANAAIDIVAEDAPGFAEGLARYAASDLLCYRAQHPAPLVQRQRDQWDPLVRWAERRFDILFAVTAGIVPVGQPAATLARLREAFAAYPIFALAALWPLVSLSGSAIIPLAMAEGALDCADGWAAAILDETFQAEQWGEDALAAASRADRRHQFEAAARFLALAGSD